MNLHRNSHRRAALAATLFTAALACAGPAQAARAADIAAQHRAEVAACNDGSSPEGHETCLYEARSAYAQQLREGQKNGNDDYAGNATLRCHALQGEDRSACLTRMAGGGTRSGSVGGGGILRELVTRTVVPATDATATAPR